MKKLLVALMFVSSIAGAACIGPYCYDDSGATITSGLSISGGVACNNISTTTLNANDLNATYGVTGATATFTGASKVGTLTLTGNAVDVTVSSPTAAGQIVRTSAYVVYISTGPGVISAWSKIGAQ